MSVVSARGIAVFAVIGVLLAPSISRADTDPRSIAVPLIGTQGAASRYPSTLIFTAPGGVTQDGPVRVRLHRVTHPCPEDLAVLLVHPGAPTLKYLLMSNAGGCRPLEGTDILFTSADVPLPDDEPVSPAHGDLLQIGVSTYGAVPDFPAPAPAGPYTMGMPPGVGLVSGAWLLYVIDTRAEHRGVIAGGWSVFYDERFYGNPDPALLPAALPAVGTGPGGAAQYPLTFDMTGARPDVRVHFVLCSILLNHAWPDNLRIVLQSPTGTSVVLMANAGGNTPLAAGTILLFGDGGGGPAPNSAALAPAGFGFFQPGGAYEANFGLGAPAPAPPYATTFAAFDGEVAAGIWRLWVYDDSAGNAGTITNAVLSVSTGLAPSLSLTTPVDNSSSTDPFVRVEGDVGSTTGPLFTAYTATWRVTNGSAFYDAGPMSIRPGTTTVFADVPLRKGANAIVVSVANTEGTASTATRTVNVDELTYALSEGATGEFFDLDVTIGNPAAVPAPLTIDFLPESGAPVARANVALAQAPLQVRVDNEVPNAAVSTVIHSTDAVPLAVERTMSWDARGYGGHGGSAISPATRWLFAEGAQGYFDTYVLLANAGGMTVDVTVNFLLEGGGVVPHAVSVPAYSRRTIDAGAIPAVVNHSFGIDITSNRPISAERAMYFPHGSGRLFEGGHESAGVNETSRSWLLAEGATGPFFECFLLLMNPNAVAANVSVTYLLPDGNTIEQPVVMPPNSRHTINVETVDPLLANTPVSARVNADVGIVAERAMYWPDTSLGWREAHNSFGVTQLGLRWGVADGRIGGPRAHDTYILLANPNAFPSEVQVRFFKADTSATRTYTLPPTSRLNIWTSQDVPELGAGLFTAEIQVLNYVPIAVEKAMYWNADNVTWAAGTSVTATRLPPP